MGILVACYGDSYGDTGSVEAWVREVVGHSATIAPSRRYHFAGQTALIVTAYRYHVAAYLSH